MEVIGHLRILRLPHKHRAVSTHVVVQRAGVPYELARVICSGCSKVLSEHPVGRTAA
jgi:hypothetical protein